MTEYLVRFLVGGVVVSAFAMLSDVLRPKSFAGLFGAAPSVALATLGIAVYRHGPDYAAFQSQAMMAGAIALAVYSVVVCHLLVRARLRAAPATLLSLLVWLIVACGLLTLAGGQAIWNYGVDQKGSIEIGGSVLLVESPDNIAQAIVDPRNAAESAGLRRISGERPPFAARGRGRDSRGKALLVLKGTALLVNTTRTRCQTPSPLVIATGPAAFENDGLAPKFLAQHAGLPIVAVGSRRPGLPYALRDRATRDIRNSRPL
jgi:uncharacterized membrane protein (GlpM family)